MVGLIVSSRPPAQYRARSRWSPWERAAMISEPVQKSDPSRANHGYPGVFILPVSLKSLVQLPAHGRGESVAPARGLQRYDCHLVFYQITDFRQGVAPIAIKIVSSLGFAQCLILTCSQPTQTATPTWSQQQPDRCQTKKSFAQLFQKRVTPSPTNSPRPPCSLW